LNDAVRECAVPNKSEGRNSKSEANPKIEIRKQPAGAGDRHSFHLVQTEGLALLAATHSRFGLRISFGPRISDFGFLLIRTLKRRERRAPEKERTPSHEN